MKQKHLFFIIYTVTLCGLLSCENEIPYNPEMKQPCLVMNALLEAGEGKTNEVYLYLSTGDNLDKVNDDAILTLTSTDDSPKLPKLSNRKTSILIQENGSLRKITKRY